MFGIKYKIERGRGVARRAPNLIPRPDLLKKYQNRRYPRQLINY